MAHKISIHGKHGNRYLCGACHRAVPHLAKRCFYCDEVLEGMVSSSNAADESPVDRMIKLQENHEDIEFAHKNADVILCEVLESCGHRELVAAYMKVSRWYS